MSKPLTMNSQIRKHHKKLAAIFAMIETLDQRIDYDTRQLNLHPDVPFWRNAHAKQINANKRTRARLYGYYASSFITMAEAVAAHQKAPAQPNHLRSERTPQSLALQPFFQS